MTEKPFILIVEESDLGNGPGLRGASMLQANHDYIVTTTGRVIKSKNGRAYRPGAYYDVAAMLKDGVALEDIRTALAAANGDENNNEDVLQAVADARLIKSAEKAAEPTPSDDPALYRNMLALVRDAVQTYGSPTIDKSDSHGARGQSGWTVWANSIEYLARQIGDAIKHSDRAISGEARFQHRKRQSTYRAIGEAQVQTDTPLVDYDKVVVYRSELDGTIWVQPKSEFTLERFEPLLDSPPAEAGADPRDTAIAVARSALIQIERARPSKDILVIGGYQYGHNECAASHADLAKDALDATTDILGSSDVATLPCDVMIAPATVLRKGVPLSTLLACLRQREGKDVPPIDRTARGLWPTPPKLAIPPESSEDPLVRIVYLIARIADIAADNNWGGANMDDAQILKREAKALRDELTGELGR